MWNIGKNSQNVKSTSTDMWGSWDTALTEDQDFNGSLQTMYPCDSSRLSRPQLAFLAETLQNCKFTLTHHPTHWCIPHCRPLPNVCLQPRSLQPRLLTGEFVKFFSTRMFLAQLLMCLKRSGPNRIPPYQRDTTTMTFFTFKICYFQKHN